MEAGEGGEDQGQVQQVQQGQHGGGREGLLSKIKLVSHKIREKKCKMGIKGKKNKEIRGVEVSIHVDMVCW